MDDSCSWKTSGRKRRQRFHGMLGWLRRTAMEPGNRNRAARPALTTLAMRAREVLRLMIDATERGFSSSPAKKQKSGEGSWEGPLRRHGTEHGSPEMLNQPVWMSQRISEKEKARGMMSHLAAQSQCVGHGPTFPVDVRDWTGPPNERIVSHYREDLDTLRWLGTRVWPPEGDDRESSKLAIGEGRPTDCICSSPGSVACVSSHVNAARLQLQADIGHAFIGWGFDSMGEEVSMSWTKEEQMRFHALETVKNDQSDCDTFWATASKYFSSKSTRELISYYFNVFLLRRARNQSRLPRNDGKDVGSGQSS